jgi:hypothetical protein
MNKLQENYESYNNAVRNKYQWSERLKPTPQEHTSLYEYESAIQVFNQKGLRINKWHLDNYCRQVMV